MTITQFRRTVAAVSAIALILASSDAFAQPAGEEEPLYDRLGGLQAISLAVNDFVDVFIQDPVILANEAVKERKSPEAAPYIKYQVTSLVCEASGGPCQYTGLDMRSAHEGLNVSEQEWDRMVVIFVETLDRLGVPEKEKEELLGLLGPSKDDIVVTTAAE